MYKSILALGAGLAVGFNAGAIPLLQLDASPAIYDPVSETTISHANQFHLYAMLKGLTYSATDKYYVVAGLLPKNAPAATLGDFVFNGTTVAVTSGMSNGKPFGWNNSHGVYPTYYSTFLFSWSSATRFDNYDVSLVGGTHTGPTADPNGKSLFMDFSVDISGLAGGTQIWYDLVEVNPSGEVVNFAPFSHADQSSNGVPDGGLTVLMLGAGLTCLGLLRSKLS